MTMSTPRRIRASITAAAERPVTVGGAKRPDANASGGVPTTSCALRGMVGTSLRAFAHPTQCLLLHHGRGLPEQQLALFFGADRGLAVIRIDLLGLGIGAHRGGARRDGFQPAFQVRE